MNKINILTGPNGAGISSARYVFEELGYYVVENVPIELSDALFDSLNKRQYKNALIITPIRNAEEVFELAKKHDEFETVLTLISCEKDELLKRFRLTRHIHPSMVERKFSLEKAIDEDLKYVDALRESAAVFVDTTRLNLQSLRSHLYGALTNSDNKISVTFISYGLKYGVPKGLDISFDVRIIPNPYWIDNLRERNGMDKEIKDYLLSFPITKQLIKSIIKYLDFYLPNLNTKERKDYTVGISCSGGQHRSTFIANYLMQHYKHKYESSVIHRDCPELNNDEH